MNNTMRVIAKAGGYEVICDANGVVSISKDQAHYICSTSSAYEMIREVPDKDIRAELLKQWSADASAMTRAEKNSKDGEFRG